MYAASALLLNGAFAPGSEHSGFASVMQTAPGQYDFTLASQPSGLLKWRCASSYTDMTYIMQPLAPTTWRLHTFLGGAPFNVSQLTVTVTQ